MGTQSVVADTSSPARLPISGNASLGALGILESPLSKPASILPRWATSRHSKTVSQASDDEVLSRSIGIDVWLYQEDVLGVTAALLVIATAVQTILHFSIPCPLTEFSRDPACRSLYQISAYISVGKFVVGCCLVAPVLYWRCWRIVCIQTRYPWLNRLAESLKIPHKVPSNHWVVSATEGLCRETFASQRVAHHLALAMQGITVTLIGLRIFQGLMFLARDSPSSPSCQDGIHTISCQLVAWRSLVDQPPWILFYAKASIFIVTPEIAWAPASIDAATKLGDITFLRILALPLTSVIMSGLLVTCAFISLTILWRDDADSWEQHLPMRKVHFISCLILSVVGASMLLWSGVLRHAVRNLRSECQNLVSPRKSMDGVPGYQQHNDRLAEHNRATVLLLILIYICCIDESPEFVVFCITTGLRIVLVVLVLLKVERTSTFDDLTVDNASLGLVVEAKQLAAALRSMVAGKPWTGRLRTYRGTVLRMQRTLAISYKWQEEDRDLTPEATINMSDFQALEVVKAIRRSRCSYVWVDKLSVPQEPGPLQRTLLSRMLPVYASARLTLAIRTIETVESSHYHKRAWTLQEFCSAPKLLVVDQDTRPGSMGYSVGPDENEYFFRLRSEVQAKLSHCKPMWLYDVRHSFSKSSSVRIIDEFKALAGMTHCQNASDKLRAFCPLLCNVTVEGHQELLKLIDAVKMDYYGSDRNAAAKAAGIIDLREPTPNLEGEMELFIQSSCASRASLAEIL